jgi:hypothetical protein
MSSNINEFNTKFDPLASRFYTMDSNLAGSNDYEIKAPLTLSGGIISNEAGDSFKIKGSSTTGTVIYNGMAIGINGGLNIGRDVSTRAPVGQLQITNDDGTASLFNNSSSNVINGRDTQIASSSSLLLKSPLTTIYGDVQWCDYNGLNCKAMTRPA